MVDWPEIKFGPINLWSMAPAYYFHEKKMNKTVGISILTNGSRRKYLARCIESFLENCHYRPLRISILDNGSTDDTFSWLRKIRFNHPYGIDYRICRNDTDAGCAQGTNQSIDLVDAGLMPPCEYQIHLESDFIHMPEEQTGIDKFWLHRAVEYMDKGNCDYLYLRRMESEQDIFQHWWSQWMPKLQVDGEEYFRCDGFWWSNNPALFRTQALKDNGTLPLNTALDGKKGEAGWSQPELRAKRPPNACIHRWGMFAHEAMVPRHLSQQGCGKFTAIGSTTCKYGFYKDGSEQFCRLCDLRKGVEDMPAHEARLRKAMASSNDKLSLGTIVLNEEVLDRHLRPSFDNDALCDIMIIDAQKGVPVSVIYNRLIEEAKGRYLILCHPDVEFSGEVYQHIKEQLSQSDVGVVGLVGVDDNAKQVWGTGLKRPRKVASLDGCFIAIDREKGLVFDEATFDGLHCYAEDLCYSARDRGLKVVVVPAKKFIHASDTLNKEGACWGNYWHYRNRLQEKWQSKMKVVTT